MASSIERPSTSKAYGIAWIAALHIERAAAMPLLDEHHPVPEDFEQHPSDTNSYSWGSMAGHSIVIASLPSGSYGTTSAATTASGIQASLPWIKAGLLVGIGGGIARPPLQDIRLGDVVVSAPNGTYGGVVQYDLGKAKLGGTWERKGSLSKPPLVLLHAIGALRANHENWPSKIPEILAHMLRQNSQLVSNPDKSLRYCYQGRQEDRLFKAEYHHIGGATCKDCQQSMEVTRRRRKGAKPEIHYGIIASGNRLVKDVKTRDQIADDLETADCLCIEMEAAGLMDHFPCLVIRGICDYADSHKNDQWQRYASATAAAYAKELLEYVPQLELRMGTSLQTQLKSMEKGIGGVQNGIGNLEIGQKNVLRAAAGISEDISTIKDIILRGDGSSKLDRLPIATEALYDSHIEAGLPQCLPNTRVSLLKFIGNRWARDKKRRPILWMRGMAGSGKSTVSRSVSARLQKMGALATFFFKRGGSDRSDLTRFFTTIAMQLAKTIPVYASELIKVLDEDDTVVHKDLGVQFRKLIAGPLAAHRRQSEKTNYTRIVIDALDECTSEENIKTVIQLLATHAKELGLRVFITSRPELPIRLSFQPFEHKYEHCSLDTIPNWIIDHDISVYFSHSLQVIKKQWNDTVLESSKLPQDWPSEETVQTLTDMASPLFIYASTICRFIQDRRLGDPESQLTYMLERGENFQLTQLDSTYGPVLNRLLADFSRAQEVRAQDLFRRIIGTIVTLESPVTISTLAVLIDTPVSEVRNHLDHFHSVLHIPPVNSGWIYLLHLSFRDYLCKPEQKGRHPFWIDEKIVHAKLARSCLRIMETKLKKDLFGLEHPGNYLRGQTGAPEDVQYACLNFSSHVSRCGSWTAWGDVYSFFTRHFLHWFEALNSGALLYRGPVQELWTLKQAMPQSCPSEHVRLLEFLNDAIEWAKLAYLETKVAPLQLYSAALIFAPRKSIVRNMFQHEIPDWILSPPKVSHHWRTPLEKIGIENDLESTCIVFSPDNKFFAIGHIDGTVRLCHSLGKWELNLKLKNGESPVYGISFSSNLRALIVQTEDGGITRWEMDDATTGTMFAALDLTRAEFKMKVVKHPGQLYPNGREKAVVTYSHDLNLIISLPPAADASPRSSTSGSIVDIWDGKDGYHIRSLSDEHFKGSPVAVAISNDSETVALALEESLPKNQSRARFLYWDLRTNKSTEKATFNLPRDTRLSAEMPRPSFSGIFSPSLAHFAIWDIQTPKALNIVYLSTNSKPKSVARFRSHRPDAQVCAAFSTTSRSIAFISTSEDPYLGIDSFVTGQREPPFRDASLRGMRSIVFSPDDRVIGMAGEQVRLLPVKTEMKYIEDPKLDDDNEQPTLSAGFSPDKSLFWSLSWSASQYKEPARIAWNLNGLNGMKTQVERLRKDGENIEIRRTDTGELVRTLSGRGWVSISPDSRLVAVISLDRLLYFRNRPKKQAHVWNIATGQCLQSISDDKNSIWSTCFSRDSKQVATLTRESVKVWDITSGVQLREFNISLPPLLATDLAFLSALVFSQEAMLQKTLSAPGKISSKAFRFTAKEAERFYNSSQFPSGTKIFSQDWEFLGSNESLSSITGLGSVNIVPCQDEECAVQQLQVYEGSATGLAAKSYPGNTVWLTWEGKRLLIMPPHRIETVDNMALLVLPASAHIIRFAPDRIPL